MFKCGHATPTFEHFYPVPICFGVVCELKQHSLKVRIVLKEYKTCQRPLTWECCTPSFPSGNGTVLLTFKCCLPPSFGFPPNLPHRKCFRWGPRTFPLKREPTILGETFGATRLTLRVTIAGPLVRARLLPRTAPLRSRHVMPLAMRPLREESGALPTHYSSSATRLTLRVTIAGPSVRHSHGRRLLRLRSE